MLLSDKECNLCKKTKLISEFYKKKRGIQHICKDCQKIRNLEYYRKNKDKIRSLQLRWNFNITADEYAWMLAEQDGCCAICGLPPRPNKALCVDHDHVTDEIRGLLCDNCNRALGLFKDSVENLEYAIKYLKS